MGYGSVKGKGKLTDRDTIFEFFVIRSYRKMLNAFFLELVRSTKADFIECQSNDFLLSSLLFEFSENISADVILFDDHIVTGHQIPDVVFRLRKEDDKIFEHKGEPIGEYVVVKNEGVIATGGFMLHYNFPFADLYMEVDENFRGLGIGTFIVQELKKECYLSGRVPAARCSIQNYASKASLAKAGLKVCGYMLSGFIKKSK